MSEEPSSSGSRPPSEDRVRIELRLFAELIRRLDEEDMLMQSLPLLQARFGDLRRLLFDYEVRATERLLPVEDPRERETRRILREIEERKEEMLDEWQEEWRPPEEDGEGSSSPA